MDLVMKYVYTVYKENSFSQAARKLFISQSAISAMIRKAEKELGCPIFDRSTIPFTLTKEGQFYIEHIEKIMALEKDIRQYFDDRSNLKTGTLRIGSSSFYSAYFLAPVFSAFQKKYPGVRVEIREGDGKDLLNDIADGSIDFLFGALSSAPANSVTENVLFSYEHLVLAVPEEFPVNGKLKPYRIPAEAVRSGRFTSREFAPVPLLELKDCPFLSLTREGSDLYQRAIDICRNAGFKPHITQQLSQIMTTYFLAAAGGGAALIRSTLLSLVREQPGLIYYKIGDPLARRPVYITYNRERYVSTAMSAFLTFSTSFAMQYRFLSPSSPDRSPS